MWAGGLGERRMPDGRPGIAHAAVDPGEDQGMMQFEGWLVQGILLLSESRLAGGSDEKPCLAGSAARCGAKPQRRAASSRRSATNGGWTSRTWACEIRNQVNRGCRKAPEAGCGTDYSGPLPVLSTRQAAYIAVSGPASSSGYSGRARFRYGNIDQSALVAPGLSHSTRPSEMGTKTGRQYMRDLSSR